MPDAVDDRHSFVHGAAERHAGRGLGEGGRRVPDDRADEVAAGADQRREQLVGRTVGVGDPPLCIQGEDALADAVEGVQRARGIEQPESGLWWRERRKS